MTVLRSLLCLVFATAPAWWVPAAAQLSAVYPASAREPADPPRGHWLPGSRSYLGLQLGRTRNETACASTALVCGDAERPAQIYTGTMVGKFWGVEMAYLSTGRMARAGAESRAQGLNFSLVGKTQLAPSVGVFGKIGTTYGRTETSPLATSLASGHEQGFGLSVGAGLSFDFTPRLSATLEWDRNDFRFADGRDPVRSTSLGLQYRY